MPGIRSNGCSTVHRQRLSHSPPLSCSGGLLIITTAIVSSSRHLLFLPFSLSAQDRVPPAWHVVHSLVHGPRGPRMRSGDGPLIVAKLSGKPILPYALSTRNRIIFKSWDRFMLPLPFGRGAIIYGEPIRLDKRADSDAIEAARAQLEASTIAANMRADSLMGKEIIEPSDTAKIARNDA